MKFLMFVCWYGDKMNAQREPDPSQPRTEEGFPWLDELQARGAWITGDQLAPPRRARTVRVRNGKTSVTDGPFIESKEHLGGFAVLDVADEEAARHWAGKIAVACGWPQEVHRFQVPRPLPETT